MAKNWAIVIGINQYRFLQPLRYAKRDAEMMQDFLEREAKFDRVFLFTDDSPDIAGKPTEPFRANLLRVLRQIFAQPFMKDGDNFWFFFSGHGIRYQEQDYLMPLDGDPEDIPNTGIATHLVTNYLRSCGADNVVLILDACRNAGKKSGEGIGRQTEAEARQTGVISIFSCNPDQYSYEIEAIEQGAFTYSLLEGLGIRGRCATVERLNQYLQNQVPQLVQQHLGRARQTPYTIAEPIDRSHLILMPQYAGLADIATLKNDAYRAQMQQDWGSAQRLWIRVLVAASGQDTDAIEALQQIAISRAIGAIPLQPLPTELQQVQSKSSENLDFLTFTSQLDRGLEPKVSVSNENEKNKVLSLKEAIYELRESITSALIKGYNFEEIASTLTTQGIEIAATTLKKYFLQVCEDNSFNLTNLSQKGEAEVNLSSERFGSNYYAKLQDLLKAGKWKEADQETADRMLEVMDRQEEGWLRVEDIQQFPCWDFKNINWLWIKYSDGKFGFSVQKKIYLECGAKLDGTYPGDNIWHEFGEQVGWRIEGNWIGNEKVIFDVLAQHGHLPWWGKWRGMGIMIAGLLLRMEACNL